MKKSILISLITCAISHNAFGMLSHRIAHIKRIRQFHTTQKNNWWSQEIDIKNIKNLDVVELLKIRNHLQADNSRLTLYINEQNEIINQLNQLDKFALEQNRSMNQIKEFTNRPAAQRFEADIKKSKTLKLCYQLWNIEQNITRQ
jgi:hypothetical protein